MIPIRCRCGRRWSSYKESHCTSCQPHTHFSCVAAFDAHRCGVGADRHCCDPAELTREDGNPRLVSVERASGPVWVFWQSAERDAANRARFTTTEGTE
jgi:hypothetical protein